MNSNSFKRLLSLLTVFAMVFSMIAVVKPLEAKAATTEIAISNGDFENGAFGGAVAGSNGASIVEKATYEGNYALKFDATGEVLTVTGYLSEATTAETTVTLSFWAKVLSGSAGNSVNYGLFPDDANWQQLVSSGLYGAGYPVVGGDWKQITKTLTVPAGLKIVQAQIYLGSADTTAVVDNISITVDGSEILTSGGFEKGALNGDFNANDALDLVFTPVHGGTYAAHADKSSGNGNISATVTINASSEERTMTFSYWMYCPTSVNSAHNLVACYDTVSNSPNWTNLSLKYGAQYATPGSWVQKTMEITVAANTDTLQIKLYAQDDGADFYIDDLMLTEEVADIVNHDVTMSLNQVTGDGTWQFAISETPDNKYYKVPATIDGTACNILMGVAGEIMCVYPNFFTALGGAVPAGQIIIEAGTVMTAVDANNSWNAIDGADTYTLTEAIDLSYVDEAWSKTIYNTDVTLTLNQVTSDGTWQFAISEVPDNKYYKVPATIDGTACNILMGIAGEIMCVYPNFFTVFGGAVPAGQIIIEAGTVMTAVDSANGWNVIEGANTLTVTNKIDLSYADDAWSKTVYSNSVEIFFTQVTGDGTWQFEFVDTPDQKYYKVPATVDGVEYSFVVGLAEGTDIMCVYPSFFTIFGGAAPAEKLVIAEGAVLKAVDSNGWTEIDDTTVLVVSEEVVVENLLGSWLDMGAYANVEFADLAASDLNVYKTEDQSASQQRSVFAISSGVAIGNEGWANFTEVASKVLVDGVETDVVFGMVPADSDGWGNESAFLLYVTGEDHRDAVSAASSVTICAGTTIISPVDTAKGFKFTEDFTMYKNCDGSWDTTADTHVYSVEDITADGAKVSDATCQSAAVYYYSCCCGALSDQTFTYGEAGDHSYVDGVCSVCGDTITIENITVSFQNVAEDGTWQLIPSAVPANTYYKAAVVIDGAECNVLVHYSSDLLLIYPNFFEALGGAVPAESFVIEEGAMLKPVDADNGWAEIEDAAVLVVTEELKVEKLYDNWYEMSKYADVTFTEVYAADLELYYQNILRLSDYSDAEIAIAKLQYPEYADMIDYYGRDANMTTFGIKSVNANVVFPNHENWPNYTVMGKISVDGAEPWETYVMQTRDSSDDGDTAMDSAFLVRFYNGLVADVAASVTIEPGTMIVTQDGEGFIFVDGYTVSRGTDGVWAEEATTVYNPVVSYNIVLGDNIGMNFVLDTGMDVVIYVDGVAVDAEGVLQTDGNYKYAIELAAAQMTSQIVIEVEGEAAPNTYSVRKYADTLLADKIISETTKELLRQMLNYGAAAQAQFGVNTDDLANTGIDVTVADPEGESALASDGAIEGVSFYGASLVYRTETAVRFYFTGSADGLTFTVGEVEYAPVSKDGMYCVEVDGINPQNLADVITLTVSNGTDSIAVSYSPLSYIVRMYGKDSVADSTKTLVKALYNYYVAAVAYVDANA